MGTALSPESSSSKLTPFFDFPFDAAFSGVGFVSSVKKKKSIQIHVHCTHVLQGLSLFWPYDLCYHGLSLVHFPIIIFGKYFSVILIYMYILLHLYTSTCIFSSIFTFIFVWTQNSVICLNDTNLFKGEGNLQFCWKINIS